MHCAEGSDDSFLASAREVAIATLIDWQTGRRGDLLIQTLVQLLSVASPPPLIRLLRGDDFSVEVSTSAVLKLIA